MSISRFKVLGTLDTAHRHERSTVVIDRTAETFTVRPLRRRRSYTLPLGFVAGMVYRHILKVEAAELRAAKAPRRLVRR